MKSLKTVQTIARVLEILAKIAMIFAFVGTGLCLVGGSVLLATGRDILASNLLEDFVELGSADVVSASVQIFSTMVLCLGTALVSAATVRYLSRELRDGTPFTLRGAKELLYLGIKMIAYPVGALILAAIICACGGAEEPEGQFVESGLGVGLILLSFVFRYGAELEQSQAPAPDQALPEDAGQP